MLKIGDKIKVRGESAKVIMVDLQYRQVEVEYEDKSMQVLNWDKVEREE